MKTKLYIPLRLTRSFDYAQDKSFGYAQDKSFDYAQDKVGVAPALEPRAKPVHGWQATGASFVKGIGD